MGEEENNLEEKEKNTKKVKKTKTKTTKEEPIEENKTNEEKEKTEEIIEDVKEETKEVISDEKEVNENEKELKTDETEKKEEVVEPKEDKKEQKEEEEKPKEDKSFSVVKDQPYKKNKSKKIFPIIFITAIICFLIVFSVIFALMNISNDKILSGISIMGIDVSGLSKEEATKKMEELAANEETEDITLKNEEYETIINGKQFSAKFDIESAVTEAYNIGKDSNIVVNNYKILFTQLFKKDIEIPLFYDEETLNNKIQDISSKIPGAVKQTNYYVEGEKLIIVRGTAGIKIKEDEIKELIINTIKQVDNKNNIINIPVENVEPDEIDLNKIKEEIYKEPQDAYVSKNPTIVHPHVNGVDFKISIEEAQEIVQEYKKEYKIPLKITKPKKTVKDLGEEAFPDLIATYSTRYDASNTNRANNLTIAAKKINGTIVMPGETFSYNKVVGERTIAAGYKEAGAYAGGQVIQSVGGGICQISSTIYNTALLANLEIIDRSNHQFETGYVPASRDATVSWGYLDFKFKNTRTYPIKIVSSAKNGVAKVTFYGIKEDKEYEVVIQSKIISYTPFSVKYIEDPNLAEGKEVIEQSGHNGTKSEAYRILKLNGKVVSQTLLSRDTYDPMQRIVRKGTKKVTATPSKPSTPTTPETPSTGTQNPGETTPSTGSQEPTNPTTTNGGETE